MKKTLISLLAILLIFASLGTAALAHGSELGYGAAVVGSEVNVIKTGLLGKKLSFSDADFKSALCLSDFESITVTEIPSSTEGTLFVGGRRVSAGRKISRRNLATLVFVPASSEVTECRFSFTVEGYAGGTEIECIMKFTDRINYAPKPSEKAVATSSLTTQESIAVYGTLSATDPESDELEYIIVSYPTEGRIEILDKANGKYCYTPGDGFTGKDSFKYVARDEYGNYSEPITVKIRVNARMSSVEYADMEGREEYNAAVAMTAMGIMNGKLIGDDMLFMPEEGVSRAEFVAMAMKTAGYRPDTTVTKTYFDDDREIAPSLKGYIGVAQRMGIINGDFKDGKLLFNPNAEITKYEAAKIMATLIGAEGEGEESVFAEDNGVPVWARAGVYAMHSLGIFGESEGENPTGGVSRANAASYLYKLSGII